MQAFLLAALCVVAAVPGCDCDKSTDPGQTTGTIVVNAEPDSLNAPWGLSGPGGYSDSGSGDETLTGRAVGQYTVTWGSVNGYVTPSPGTGTLAAGDTLTLVGTYVEDGGPPPPGMITVPAGSFTMGQVGAFCAPEHGVRFTHGFYLDQYEVTNQEYTEAVQWAYDNGYVTATASSAQDDLDGSTTELLNLDSSDCEISFSAGVFSCANPDHPVIEVTWYGAARYCDWLSLQAGLPRAYQHSGDWSCNSGDPYGAAGYRLPTDAEWEYAAQYDDDRVYPWGSESPTCALANYSGCMVWTSPVGSCPAGNSALGFSDMAGNVWEWCNDWWVCNAGDEYVQDPVGPSTGSWRAVRGGAWTSGGNDMKSANRYNYGGPESSASEVGFRAAKTVGP